MSFTRFFSGLALIAGLTLATEARAQDDDEKVYTANFCRAVSGSITYGTYGAISNASTTSDLTVECPIVRDSTESSVDFIDVLVRDRNAVVGEDIVCRIRERKESGSTEESLLFATPNDGVTAATGYEEIVMYLDSAGPDSYDAVTNSGLILRCTIPPSSPDTGTSFMFIYEIQEN